MRVRAIGIENFRSIENILLPLDGLVVLIGANSSGKTTVLESVRGLLTRSGTPRVDPFDPQDFPGMPEGFVVFELNGSGLGGHPDTELHRRLLAGELSIEQPSWPWSFIQEGLVGLVGGSPLTDVQDFIALSMAEMPGPGSAEDRLLVAEELLRSRFFKSTWDETWLVAFADEMSAKAIAAAGRIDAASGDEEDPLLDAARTLCRGGMVDVAGVADGSIQSDELRLHFGGVVDVNADTSGIARQIHADLVAVHDLMWELPIKGHKLFGRMTRSIDTFLIRDGSGFRTFDPWLEELDEPAEARVYNGPVDADRATSWQRLRLSLVMAAQLLAQHANDLAPTFVRDLGTIKIDLLPPSHWHQDTTRVRVSFDEGDGRRDLGLVGAGVSRWVAASLRLAALELRQADRVVRDTDGGVVSDSAQLAEVIGESRKSPIQQTAIRLELRPPSAPIVYLVDEPEAHLHPAAVASIAEWLGVLVDRGHEVIVATHHPALLTRLAGRGNVMRVTKVDRTTELRDITASLQDGLDNAQLGLTAGDLLLMLRAALFVEGPHDQAVLLAMFSEMFAAAGVKLFPLHGIDHVSAIVESEVIEALGIRMAVLTDNLDTSRPRRGSPTSHEEWMVDRLRREAKASGKTVKVFGLQERDILQYLDAEVCRSNAPSFPGWDAAARQWKVAARHSSTVGRGPTFKEYVSTEYGLRLDRGSVAELAALAKRADRIPAELERRVREICAWATSPTVERSRH
jgi:energy-coupling factor transporter ATP-binding protein EcfA2